MNSKHILGYVTLGILLAAVAFAAYLWVSDYVEESNQPEPESVPDLEYTLTFTYRDDEWTYSLHFWASADGWLRLYLGDEVLENRLGDPMFRNFRDGKEVGLTGTHPYDGMTPEQIEDAFEIEWYGQFNPVRAQ